MIDYLFMTTCCSDVVRRIVEMASVTASSFTYTCSFVPARDGEYSSVFYVFILPGGTLRVTIAHLETNDYLSFEPKLFPGFEWSDSQLCDLLRDDSSQNEMYIYARSPRRDRRRTASMFLDVVMAYQALLFDDSGQLGIPIFNKLNGVNKQ